MNKTKDMVGWVFGAIITLVIVCLCTSSCSARPDYPIVDTRSVKYCRESGPKFGFNINIVTNKKDSTIEFVSCTGENIDSLDITLNDDTWANLKELSVNGSYLKIIGLLCVSNAEYVRLDSVRLSIDGNEKEYTFPDPVVFHLAKEQNIHYAHVLSTPFLIDVLSIEPVGAAEYPFVYESDDSIVITGFDFNKFFEPSAAMVYVNGEYIGALDTVLPLRVAAGSEIKILSKIKFSPEVDAAYIENVYCNSCLYYKHENDGEEFCLSAPMTCQSAINEEQAKGIVRSLVERSVGEKKQKNSN